MAHSVAFSNEDCFGRIFKWSEAVVLVLLWGCFLIDTPAFGNAAPVVQPETHVHTRVIRGGTADIPLDKQVKCGLAWICDSRVEFCDEAITRCGSCEHDVCHPERFKYEGGKEDCQYYCPEYWHKQQYSSLVVIPPALGNEGPRQSNNRIIWVVLGVTLTAGIVIAVTVVVACRRTRRISRGAQQQDAGENVVQEEVQTNEAIRGGTEERTGGTVHFYNNLTAARFHSHSGRAVCHPTDEVATPNDVPVHTQELRQASPDNIGFMMPR